MNTHLSEDQITHWLLGDADAETSKHLAQCGRCRAEAQQWRNAMAEFGKAARAHGERPEFFWARQKAAIVASVDASRRALALWWAGAGALAMIAVAALLMVSAPAPRPLAQTDPDEVLLMQVQAAVEREVPSALAPVAVITAERNRIARASLKQTSY